MAKFGPNHTDVVWTHTCRLQSRAMPAPKRAIAYALELTDQGMRRSIRYDDGTDAQDLVNADLVTVVRDPERGIVEALVEPTLPERMLDDSPQEREDAPVLHDQ